MLKQLYFFKMDAATAVMGFILGAFMSFIAPVQTFLVMAFALIVCDLITGTMAARHRKEKIHSKGLGRSIDKMVLYFIAIALAELFRVTFLQMSFVDNFPIVYIVSITISIRELKSNFENIEAVTGTNLWTNIKDKISDIITLFKTPKP